MGSLGLCSAVAACRAGITASRLVRWGVSSGLAWLGGESEGRESCPRWGGELGCRAGRAVMLWRHGARVVPPSSLPRAQPSAHLLTFSGSPGVAAGQAVPWLQVWCGSRDCPFLLGMTVNNFSFTLLLIISSPMTRGPRLCERCFFTHSETDIKLTWRLFPLNFLWVLFSSAGWNQVISNEISLP